MDFANVVFGSIFEEGSVGILSDEANVPLVIFVVLKFGMSPSTNVASLLVGMLSGRSGTSH